MDAQNILSDEFSFGRTVVVPRRRELSHDGARVEIGDRAFDLLLALVSARGSILSKDRIMDLVWEHRIVEENTLEAQISALRRALGKDRAVVRTVVGRGYQFVGELILSAPNGLPASSPTTKPFLIGARLPATISPIIGRDKEVREVADLSRRHRLVTLVGPGGIGKTRLAIDVAHQLASKFTDGVYLAELAATSAANYLPATLAVALGFAPGDGTISLDRIAASLSTRNMLLLLDNCEHLVEGVAQIAETLLQIAPQSSILATSREPLRIAGETTYRVPSLGVPSEEDGYGDAGDFGAIRLLEERIGDSEPGSSWPLKTRICRRLDGIPLAIELAAACVPLIGLAGVADRLDDRFRLLTRGARTAVPRQQTLQATLEWSYGLLSDLQRTVLVRLSPFADTFTLAAAQAVASSSQEHPDVILEALFALVEKSLVSVVPGPSEVQYRLLETTRAFAQAKFASESRSHEAARRHAGYFLDVFRRAEQSAAERIDRDWNASFAPHLADLRAAVEWGFSHDGDPAIAVDLTIASIPLSMHLALLEETLARVDKALAWLERDDGPAGENLMKLYAARGICLLCQTVEQRTLSAFENALRLAEKVGSGPYQLLGMWGCWMCLYLNGHYAQSLPMAERFHAEATTSEWSCDHLAAHRLLGISHLLLGHLDLALTHLGRAAGSCAYLPKAQRIRFLYDERTLSHTSLAHTLWFLGQPDQAMLAASQALADARELDHPVSLCYALSEGVCTLALLTGDDPALHEAVRAMTVETRRHGIATWKARAEMWRGFLDLRAGDEDAFDRLIRPAISRLGSKRYYISLTPFLSETAILLASRGRFSEARMLIEPTVAWAAEMGDICCLPELQRAKAEVLLLEGGPSAVATAEAMVRAALVQARSGGYLSWELRCATALARLAQREGREHASLESLSDVVGRFSEGFKTRDLTAADALLTSSSRTHISAAFVAGRLPNRRGQDAKV